MSVATLDLFAGAGGLSLGAAAAGLAPVAAVEFNHDACETYKMGHPQTIVMEQDIRCTDFRPFAGAVDVVIGGPPCQPFSMGGKRLATEDPRNGIPQFLRAIAEISPRAFILENVPGLAKGEPMAYLGHVLSELEQGGYLVSWQVLRAVDFGVPQKRQRLFVVGLRSDIGDGRPFVFPEATHGPSCDVPHASAGAFLTATQPVGELNSSIVTYARNPSLRPNAYDGHLFNGGGRPIDLTRPAPTMLASMGGNKTPWLDVEDIVPGYHAELLAGGVPRQGRVPGARRLTVEEAAAIQTFPKGMRFAGPRSSQYRQVGNAVPPLLAEVVARGLRERL